LLKLAINDGPQKAKQLSDNRMGSITSGISLPPGF
jgi:DNA-binding protein YbaB